MSESNGSNGSNGHAGDGAVATAVPVTTRKDWTSDQEVRWCPGCGDYSILAAVQMLMPELGVRRENTVFLSGIGCAARFPYYMSTYGMHSIHGRAPAIATGLATTRPTSTSGSSRATVTRCPSGATTSSTRCAATCA